MGLCSFTGWVCGGYFASGGGVWFSDLRLFVV